MLDLADLILHILQIDGSVSLIQPLGAVLELDHDDQFAMPAPADKLVAIHLDFHSALQPLMIIELRAAHPHGPTEMVRLAFSQPALERHRRESRVGRAALLGTQNQMPARPSANNGNKALNFTAFF